MKSCNVMIAFPVQLDTDGNGFSYVEDTRISVSCYASEHKAKETLKAGIAKELDEALALRQHAAIRLIGTKDGTVFCVHFRYNSFWYDIAGPDRPQCGSCGGNWKTLEEAVASARQHAESGFGGIAWESHV